LPAIFAPFTVNFLLSYGRIRIVYLLRPSSSTLWTTYPNFSCLFTNTNSHLLFLHTYLKPNAPTPGFRFFKIMVEVKRFTSLLFF